MDKATSTFRAQNRCSTNDGDADGNEKWEEGRAWVTTANTADAVFQM